MAQLTNLHTMSKTISLFIFLIICSATGYCQGDTVYYDHDWNKGTFDNAEYYRVIHKEGSRFKIEDYYLNNNLQMTGYYSDLEKETKDGYFVYYYNHGHKKWQGNFINDLRTGKWEGFYDTTGNIWYTANYKEGWLVGELVSYYRSGKIKIKIKRKEQHKYNDTAVTGKSFDEQGNEISFMPFYIFPKPLFDLKDFLTRAFRYPEVARHKNITGRINVKFCVNEDGSVSDITLLNRLGGGCDQEAYKVISWMPKWSPAIFDDCKVKEYLTQPIVFRLE